MVDQYIHFEVKHLYVDAQPPQLKYKFTSPNQMIMLYRSSLPLADLAEGLIRGCIDFYQEKITLHRDNLSVKKGAKCKFTLTKLEAI